MSDDDRRKADEAFKFKIIEQLAEIKGDIKEIKADTKEHGERVLNIETALWGYPKGDSPGLLEKHRSMLKMWAIIISIASFLAAATARIISPIYDKLVSDWAFNSPSEKWVRESARPKVKIYKIYRKSDAAEAQETTSLPSGNKP